jgi:hypothetical protein
MAKSFSRTASVSALCIGLVAIGVFKVRGSDPLPVKGKPASPPTDQSLQGKAGDKDSLIKIQPTSPLYTTFDFLKFIDMEPGKAKPFKLVGVTPESLNVLSQDGKGGYFLKLEHSGLKIEGPIIKELVRNLVERIYKSTTLNSSLNYKGKSIALAAVTESGCTYEKDKNFGTYEHFCFAELPSLSDSYRFRTEVNGTSKLKISAVHAKKLDYLYGVLTKMGVMLQIDDKGDCTLVPDSSTLIRSIPIIRVAKEREIESYQVNKISYEPVMFDGSVTRDPLWLKDKDIKYRTFQLAPGTRLASGEFKIVRALGLNALGSISKELPSRVHKIYSGMCVEFSNSESTNYNQLEYRVAFNLNSNLSEIPNSLLKYCRVCATLV